MGTAMSASYALMDTETDNLVGSFPSRVAALQAVAATADAGEFPTTVEPRRHVDRSGCGTVPR